MRDYTLWGWTGNWSGVVIPLRIMSGSLRDCRSRERQFKSDYSDALTGTYGQGDEPKGLILQVKERVAK